MEVDVSIKESQKEKAVQLFKRLGIFKLYIDGFVKEDKVCFFECFGGYWVYQEPEIEKKMREIEEEYGAKVYAITHERVYGDDVWSFLLVTSSPEDWVDLIMPADNGFYAFAYVWNKSYDYDSEFGDVVVQSMGGGLRRVA